MGQWTRSGKGEGGGRGQEVDATAFGGVETEFAGDWNKDTVFGFREYAYR